MKTPQTLAELDRLISNAIPESLHLEYKASESLLGKEISKDVSAFANSDGGVIIYGIVEKDHLPVRIAGIDEKTFNQETLENVITSNISPRVAGIEIFPIPLGSGTVSFVVEIPKSYGHAHQDRVTKRYYKRFNFKSEAMEDYEIEDVRHRRNVRPPLVGADLELRDSTWVDLVVQNIGNAVAQDITFQLSPDVPELTRKMAPNFVTRGIRHLPPGKSLRMSCGAALDLVNDDGSREYPSAFEVEVTYYDPRVERRVSHAYELDARNYLHTPIIESDVQVFAGQFDKSVDKLIREITNVKTVLEKISPIAGPTGINLSISAIKNLQHLYRGVDQIEKTDAFTCSAFAFREILGVDIRTALRLHHFFHYRIRQGTRIEDVTGLTPELLERLRTSFIVQEQGTAAPP